MKSAEWKFWTGVDMPGESLSKPYGRAFLASLPDCPTDFV